MTIMHMSLLQQYRAGVIVISETCYCVHTLSGADPEMIKGGAEDGKVYYSTQRVLRRGSGGMGGGGGGGGGAPPPPPPPPQKF